MAVRYALAGARLLSEVVATGETALDGVASELKSSNNQTDNEAASDIEKAAGCAGTGHPEFVKEKGLACSE